jgi:hypothetical protein
VRVSHRFTTGSARFDEDNLVSHAGLVPLLGLAEQTRLPEIIAETVSVKTSRIKDHAGDQRRWAVEDCRHLSRRLERDLLAAGEHVTRVPPKLMAHVRDSARTFGKSDPIDAPAVALAVARAVLRKPDLPTARLDGPDREVRLLGDHRGALVAEPTRTVNRLRWHLQELDPTWDPAPRSLDRVSAYDKIAKRLLEDADLGDTADGPTAVVVRLAGRVVGLIGTRRPHKGLQRNTSGRPSVLRLGSPLSRSPIRDDHAV